MYVQIAGEGEGKGLVMPSKCVLLLNKWRGTGSGNVHDTMQEVPGGTP